MPRYDELRSTTSRGIRSERIVTRHVRMNNLDLFSSHKLLQLACTRHVDRVSQREGEDLFWRQLQVSRQRRRRTHRYINIMTSRDQSIREIDYVTLATTEGRC